jgi:hypothetical protein
MSRGSTRCKYAVLAQVCKLIPACCVSRLARRYGVEAKARTFSPWSHVVALLYAQLTHALSLHDVCDGLAHHAGKLLSIRGATPPSKNALSHANRGRDASMAEALFWETLGHLSSMHAGFGGRSYRAMPRRFGRVIRAVDATTIRLVANCMDWAKHRRRKAAAKLHVSLNLESFLPSFAVVDAAHHHEKTHAAALCANMKDGEIAVFDKGLIDFGFLRELTCRGVFWVTRAKENLTVRCVKHLQRRPEAGIISDRLVVLRGKVSRGKYPEVFRVVRAWVEVDGEMREMAFMTNNLQWSPASICDLYRSRWAIEVFFREIKQTLQLCDFLGHNRNAIAWQIWMALLLYVLLRFLGFVHGWQRGFKRLICLVRACVWDARPLTGLLGGYGTARGMPAMAAAPQQAWLPGFEP